MLDLDTLASRRAASVNEVADKWLKSVWSPLFQKLSQNMSDGEIELLLSSCPSHAHFESVLDFLRGEEKHAQPLAELEREAQRSGKDLPGWIQGLR